MGLVDLSLTPGNNTFPAPRVCKHNTQRGAGLKVVQIWLRITTPIYFQLKAAIDFKRVFCMEKLSMSEKCFSTTKSEGHMRKLSHCVHRRLNAN